MSKLTLKRKEKFKDAYDIMKFGVESGNWKNSFATYYKIPSPTKDGMIYERVFFNIPFFSRNDQHFFLMSYERESWCV